MKISKRIRGDFIMDGLLIKNHRKINFLSSLSREPFERLFTMHFMIHKIFSSYRSGCSRLFTITERGTEESELLEGMFSIKVLCQTFMHVFLFSSESLHLSPSAQPNTSLKNMFGNWRLIIHIINLNMFFSRKFQCFSTTRSFLSVFSYF